MGKSRFRSYVCGLAAVGQSGVLHAADYFKNSRLASSICEVDTRPGFDFLHPVSGDGQRDISTLRHKAEAVGGREPNLGRSCNSPKIVTFWMPHCHLRSRLDVSRAKFWPGEIHEYPARQT